MAFKLTPCWMCSKPPENGQSRIAEGYLVVGRRNGQELTVVCPACEDTGYTNHEEAEVWLKEENKKYAEEQERTRSPVISGPSSQ